MQNTINIVMSQVEVVGYLTEFLNLHDLLG